MLVAMQPLRVFEQKYSICLVMGCRKSSKYAQQYYVILYIYMSVVIEVIEVIEVSVLRELIELYFPQFPQFHHPHLPIH